MNNIEDKITKTQLLVRYVFNMLYYAANDEWLRFRIIEYLDSSTVLNPLIPPERHLNAIFEDFVVPTASDFVCNEEIFISEAKRQVEYRKTLLRIIESIQEGTEQNK